MTEPASIFNERHTHSAWRPEAISDATLGEIYELARLGPTSANCSPLRIVFVRTPEGKERLRPALVKGNIEKTITAPVTAILATDSDYLDRLPTLFNVGYDARVWFTQCVVSAAESGVRNAFLQIGYLIVAARIHGVDCGPMAGFNPDLVDAEFLSTTSWRTLLLMNMGIGLDTKPYKRLPRLSVEEACLFR